MVKHFGKELNQILRG